MMVSEATAWVDAYANVAHGEPAVWQLFEPPLLPVVDTKRFTPTALAG